MKKKFKLEDYKGDYAMHCSTNREANIFCDFLSKNKRTWLKDAPYYHWSEYTDNPYFAFNDGTWGIGYKAYGILEFGDFDWSEDENEIVKKKKFYLEDYNGKYVMHCNTEEKAEIFCRFLHECGKKWVSVTSYLSENNWDTVGTDTCYAFNIDEFSDIDYYIDEDYIVLEFNNFDWGNNDDYINSLIEDVAYLIQRLKLYNSSNWLRDRDIKEVDKIKKDINEAKKILREELNKNG